MQESRSLTAMVQDATVQGYMGALLVPSRAIAACAVVGQKSAPVSGGSLHLLSFTRGKNHGTREEQQHHGATRASSGLACFLAASALAVATATWSPSAQAFCLRSLVTPSAIESHALLCFSEPALPRNEQIILSVAAPALNAKDSADCTASHTAVAKEPEIEEVTNESIIAEAWQVVNERYLDARHHKWSEDAWLKKREEVLKRPIPSRMAAYSIIRSMLLELNDPYTRFITPRELKQLSKYDMTGIGLSLGGIGVDDNDTSLRVVGIVLGSPAQMAGVKQGDQLLSVNGVDVHGKSAFDASSLIQGLKGTLVSIEVRHEPCGDTQTVSVERQQSVQTPVYYRLEHRAGDLIGYIRLKEFNAVAKRDMVAAMNKLKGAGAASFLLDLRDNPGGLVQAGIEIAKVFLEEGNTVVYTVAKDSEIQKRISASSPPLTRAPLMVLVNEHTASASEIVAAALHDNCRAVLVGHRTFGKGLIQSVFELSDGSGVILTVGKYVTPYHQDIDGNGILPDFQELPGLVDVKKQLQTCTPP